MTMENFSLTDLMGYLASLLLMTSFLMKDLKRLRLVNSTGCLCFVVYGFMLGMAWPIIITNGFILLVNIWHLSQIKK